MTDMRVRNSKTGKISTWVGSHTLGPDEEFEAAWMWRKAEEALSGLPVRVKEMYPAGGAHNWKVVLDVVEGREIPTPLTVEVEVKVQVDGLPDDDLRSYLVVGKLPQLDKIPLKKLKVSLNHEKIMGLLAEATGLVPVISRGSTFLDYPCQDGSV